MAEGSLKQKERVVQNEIKIEKLEEGEIKRTLTNPNLSINQNKQPQRTTLPAPKAKVSANLGRTAAVVTQPPVLRVKKGILARIKRFLGLESKTDKAIRRVGLDETNKNLVRKQAREILKQVDPKLKLHFYSDPRRAKMFYRKKDCQQKAIKMNVNNEAILARETEKMTVMRKLNSRDFALSLKSLADCSINFMSFKNDENFLKHYEESIRDLSNFAALAPILMDMKQSNIDILNRAYKVKLPSIQTLQDAAISYTYARDWYVAKYTQIKNQYYSILKDSDFAELSPEELDTKIKDARARGKFNLAEYMECIQKKNKAQKLGIKHVNGSDRSKWRSWGNSGRTAHKWGIELFSAKTSFKYPPAEIFSDKKKLAKYILDLDVNTKAEVLKKSQLTEDDLKKGETSKKWKATDPEIIKKNLLEIDKKLVKADVKLKALKGRYHLKKKYFSFGANASLGAVEASGKVGANLQVGSEFHGKAYANLSASASAIKSRVKMSLGTDKLNLYTKAQAKVATASAKLSGGVGKLSVKDEKGDFVDVYGAAGELSAQAALVEAETSGGICIFGIRLGASLTVQGGGFGGTVGGYATGTNVGVTFGALFGIGFKLSLTADWSGFLKWWKTRKEKKALKKKQKEEMKKRMQAERDKKKQQNPNAPPGKKSTTKNKP